MKMAGVYCSCGPGLTMPFCFVLMSVDQGLRPLLVVPTDGVAIGSATEALKHFTAHVVVDTAGCRAEELSLPSVAVIHYKLLPGNAVMAAVLCRSWENPYECMDALRELETVLTPPRIHLHMR